jgi:hypothetical protein
VVAGGCGNRVEGASADLKILGSNKNRSEQGRREKEKGVGCSDFEKQQTNEFKCKFEFKHTKPMHQHVCNIKLL